MLKQYLNAFVMLLIVAAPLAYSQETIDTCVGKLSFTLDAEMGITIEKEES